MSWMADISSKENRQSRFFDKLQPAIRRFSFSCHFLTFPAAQVVPVFDRPHVISFDIPPVQLQVVQWQIQTQYVSPKPGPWQFQRLWLLFEQDGYFLITQNCNPAGDCCLAIISWVAAAWSTCNLSLLLVWRRRIKKPVYLPVFYPVVVVGSSVHHYFPRDPEVIFIRRKLGSSVLDLAKIFFLNLSGNWKRVIYYFPLNRMWVIMLHLNI